MFWKLTAIKIGYTMKASCVILVFRLKWAKSIMQMMGLFSSCSNTTTDDNTRQQNS